MVQKSFMKSLNKGNCWILYVDFLIGFRLERGERMACRKQESWGYLGETMCLRLSFQEFLELSQTHSKIYVTSYCLPKLHSFLIYTKQWSFNLSQRPMIEKWIEFYSFSPGTLLLALEFYLWLQKRVPGYPWIALSNEYMINF